MFYNDAAFFAQSLDELADEVARCTLCPLHEGRIHGVFGEGDPHARVMVVGEAPGANEDKTGRPFVGAAGKRLDALLALAGLTRGEVYIANVVKCRPPSNRNPKVEEVEACSDYLRAQVAAIRPDAVVTLGNFATRFILKTDAGISELRGCPVDLGAFTVFPVYHPAAAIYDRSKQAVLEDDFRAIGRFLGTAPSDEAEGPKREGGGDAASASKSGSDS